MSTQSGKAVRTRREGSPLARANTHREDSCERRGARAMAVTSAGLSGHGELYIYTVLSIPMTRGPFPRTNRPELRSVSDNHGVSGRWWVQRPAFHYCAMRGVAAWPVSFTSPSYDCRSDRCPARHFFSTCCSSSKPSSGAPQPVDLWTSPSD